MSKEHKYWLFKTEPSDYTFQQLETDKKTNWNHVRNYQARNFLRDTLVGENAIIYHTGDEKCAVGIAEIVSKPYTDPDKDFADDTWTQVDVKFIKKLNSPVPLADMKNKPELKDLLLFRNGRLSIIPLSKDQYNAIIRLGT